MFADIIDENHERIKSDLVSRGLTYDRLIDDLLDHVCCMVEESMEKGGDFESSYRQVLGSIGEKRLPEIQHQTLLNLDKTFQRMKQFTYLFGLSAVILTLLGALFKKMYWPGAGILISVGMALVVLVFLPLYFVTSYREQAEKKNPVFAIVGYLTMGLLLAGVTFKNMHWPGANALVWGGLGFLVLGFVPLYVVNAFQRSGKRKITLPYIVMLLVGITIVVLFSNIRMSKNLLDIYRAGAVANENSVEVIRERTADLLELMQDSASVVQLQAISGIHNQAMGLQMMIGEMQEGLKSYKNQRGVPIEELKWVDLRGAGKKTIFDPGIGREFFLEAKKYKTVLEELIKDPVMQNQLEDHLEFVGDVWNHEYGPGQLRDAPLIVSYYKNTDASKGIALSEYVAISYLLGH